MPTLEFSVYMDNVMKTVFCSTVYLLPRLLRKAKTLVRWNPVILGASRYLQQITKQPLH